MRRGVISCVLSALVVASTCQADSNFVAFMNSQIGTWEYAAKQTGPDPMTWTTRAVVTRRGSGSAMRWRSEERTVFADGEIRNDSITTTLIKGGGWQFEGIDLSGRFYPGGKASMRINNPQPVNAAGRWSLKGRKTMQINFRFRGYRNTSTTTILGPKLWRTITTGSDGSRTVVDARKLH